MYGNVTEFTLIDNNNLSYRNGEKKCYLYLPKNVDVKTARIILAFDGQNLFSKASGNYPLGKYGSMDIDEIITDKNYNYIVVGIDNDDKYRDRELTMSEVRFGSLDKDFPIVEPLDNFKNGKLDDLGNFINQTLFPYLEKRLDRPVTAQHIYICGASSGGLASLYLGLRDHYRSILAMSPACLLFKSESFKKFYENKDKNLEIYLYNGYQDGYLSTPLDNLDSESLLCIATRREYENLKQEGFTNVVLDLDLGIHNEECWKKALERFLVLKEGK